MRKRTRARELALQFLYQVDLIGEDTLRDLEEFLAAESKEPEVRRFASDLVRGTWSGRVEIDELIRKIAKNWDLHRMAALDRNILRMAIYEMRHADAAPPKVVINEAIELGKRYSTQHSGKFVNGILDRAKQLLFDGVARSAAASGVPTALDEEAEAPPPGSIASALEAETEAEAAQRPVEPLQPATSVQP